MPTSRCGWRSGLVAERPVGQATYLLLPGMARMVPGQACCLCLLVLLQSKVFLFAMSYWPKPNSISSSAVGCNFRKPHTSWNWSWSSNWDWDWGSCHTVGCHMCTTGYKTVFGSIDFVFVQFCNISLCCNFFIYANACAIF